MIETANQSPVHTQVWLYHTVYENRTVRLFCSALVLWLVLQPGLTFANASPEDATVETPVEQSTIETSDTSVKTTDTEEQPTAVEEPEIASSESTADRNEVSPSVPPPSQIEDDETKNTTVPDGAVESSETDVANATTAETKSELGSNAVELLQPATATTSAVAQATTTSIAVAEATVVSTTSTNAGVNAQAATTSDTSSTTTSTAASADSGSARESDTDVGTASSTPAESTSLDVLDTVVPVETVTTNDNFFQFSQDECVRVEDGSFYCGGNTAPSPAQDMFYVALDADGDREIFASHDGESVQITRNRYDDAAPHYDPMSDTLVWHALIDGRYQIMSYDFMTAEVTQLTDDSQNSMEPSRSGDVTAWQQWGENSWDIMIHDGNDLVQVTTDDVSDIAPSVQDGLVIWKRVFAGEQRIAMYDITQAQVVDLAASDVGAAVGNPRMMLVFESTQPNGDRITQGFDPVTRELVPLSSTPAPMPEELPSSEPTDEVRALVHAKPAAEEEVVSTVPDRDTDTDTATSLAATPFDTVATSSGPTTVASSTFDLVVPSATTSRTATASTTEPIVSAPVDSQVPASSTIPDVVIPPFATSSDR